MITYFDNFELSSERLVIKMLNQSPAKASKALSLHPLYSGTIFDVHLTQGVLKLQFKLQDEFENILKSPQLVNLGSYEGTSLLDSTYEMTMTSKWDGTKTTMQGLVAMTDSDGMITLQFKENIVSGNYNFELHLSTQEIISASFDVTSSSTLISPLLSTAIVDSNIQYTVGDLA